MGGYEVQGGKYGQEKQLQVWLCVMDRGSSVLDSRAWIAGYFKTGKFKKWSFCEGFIALFYYRKGSWQTKMLQPLMEIENWDTTSRVDCSCWPHHLMPGLGVIWISSFIPSTSRNVDLPWMEGWALTMRKELILLTAIQYRHLELCKIIIHMIHFADVHNPTRHHK